MKRSKKRWGVGKCIQIPCEACGHLCRAPMGVTVLCGSCIQKLSSTTFAITSSEIAEAKKGAEQS